MKQIAEIVEKQIVKDKMGRILEGQGEYVPIRSILVSEVVPYGSRNAQRDYGYEVQTTHRVFSFDEIETPAYLRINGVNYFIAEVMQYPKVNAILLERM
jgi:hypothetical protein